MNWHANPLKFKGNLNNVQKHNKFVDDLKDKYAALRCIPILRIWEDDIRNNKQKVLEELQKYIDIGLRKKEIEEELKREETIKKNTNINMDVLRNVFGESFSQKGKSIKIFYKFWIDI